MSCDKEKNKNTEVSRMLQLMLANHTNFKRKFCLVDKVVRVAQRCLYICDF